MAAPVGKKPSVLFICLGNICRSPIAEAILLHLVKEKGENDKWVIDSAATADYHTGKSPEPRTMSTLAKKGISGYSHKARPLTEKDYRTFDIIFGMDDSNMEDLKEMRPSGNCKADLQMLGNWDPEPKKDDKIIVDPYYTRGTKGFDEVFEQCLRCLTAFVDAHSS